MRITNTMLVKDMLWNANNNLVAMSKKQTELSTGKRIHRPSDDPVGITQVLKYKTDIREAQQYGKNITDAQGWLEMSESALTNLKDVLQRVRELTVQAANGTNTPEDTQKISTEIAALTKEVLVAGNATSAGRYLFSGLQTDQKLFNDDGSYNIDLTSDRAQNKYVVGYEVSVGEVMTVGSHPIDIFGLIDGNSFFKNIITESTAMTSAATKTTLTANINVDHNYSTEVLGFDIGGTTYTVDTSTLDNTPLNPVTKQKLVDAIKGATDGTNVLSSVADVYFDINDQLVIQSKSFGSGTTIALSGTTTTGAPDLTSVTVTNGLDGSTATLLGTNPLIDADILAESGTYSIVVQLDDQRKTIDVDFSGLSNSADLQTFLQGAIDTAFPPAGTISANLSGTNTLDFSVSGINDGNTHTLSVDYIEGKQSEMVLDLQNLMTALNTKDDTVIQISLSKLDLHLDRVLVAMGEIGGRTNRIDFIKNRVEENEISFTSLLSKVQDVDMAEAIMYFKNLENVYRASLSVGSKVIQPSLVDFIR